MGKMFLRVKPKLLLINLISRYDKTIQICGPFHFCRDIRKQRMIETLKNIHFHWNIEEINDCCVHVITLLTDYNTIVAQKQLQTNTIVKSSASPLLAL